MGKILEDTEEYFPPFFILFLSLFFFFFASFAFFPLHPRSHILVKFCMGVKNACLALGKSLRAPASESLYQHGRNESCARDSAVKSSSECRLFCG